MTWNELSIWKKGIPKVIDKVNANVIIQFFAKNGQEMGDWTYFGSKTWIRPYKSVKKTLRICLI